MAPSRVVAPAAAEVDRAGPPVFPLLPYVCLAYAEHYGRDYADYMDRLTGAEDAPVAPGGALGLKVLNDMNQAFYTLVWGPWADRPDPG